MIKFAIALNNKPFGRFVIAPMRKIRVTRSVIPNLFTLMNLFCGFMAITRIAGGEFMGAAGFIVLAGWFDVMDGAVARLTKSTSEFGGELDSLCDAVSFGVAPAFLLYKVYFQTLGDIGVVIASLPALAGVLRLARYNVQSAVNADKRYFRGMPIPAGALTILSYTLFYHIGSQSALIPQEWKSGAITLVTLLVAGIMVSTIKYDAVPTPSARVFREKPLLMAYFLLGVILTIASKGVLLFPFMLSYMLIGLVRGSYNFLKTYNDIEEDEDTIEEEF
ncbi:MAG: CDP-diacylglycerol--serine O-phosphatidyltransferase [Candidatus Kapabacteria bacterium]|nr:CDP-diacylglycerol--serine O-phosphatidyltransferase [Candidatus Kapabacteria bacterium]